MLLHLLAQQIKIYACSLGNTFWFWGFFCLIGIESFVIIQWIILSLYNFIPDGSVQVQSRGQRVSQAALASPGQAANTALSRKYFRTIFWNIGEETFHILTSMKTMPESKQHHSAKLETFSLWVKEDLWLPFK